MTSENNLNGRTVLITGGTRGLGREMALCLARAGATLCITGTKRSDDFYKTTSELASISGDNNFIAEIVNVCDLKATTDFVDLCIAKFFKIDVLINNAASNPTMNINTIDITDNSRIENMPIEDWNKDLSVGLTGAFLCSRTFGYQMAIQKKGVILNIASDLALIGPDQRIYKKEGLTDENQPVKPVTYSVVKSGLIGLTKYLATYWNDKGVRVNALVPGGVYDGQSPEFVDKLSKLIPLGRMADANEYKSSVAYLISDASSYMTGSILVVDGGRTAW